MSRIETVEVGGTEYTLGVDKDSTITFTEAQTRTNIASGESLATMFGKIKKFFTDLKTVAFTGNVADMSDVTITSPASGDTLFHNGTGWENKPIGEATGLASINTKGATNTTGSTINAGTYFYLDGVLVRALANIANNASFTLNTNYEVVSVGALNELSTAKTYYATGKIASGYESASVFEGHGFASVELHPDHTCEVRFTFTVTNTDTQNIYHGGISLTEIKTRNPNIPDIKPVTGGFMVMVDSNGIIPAETSTTGTASTENGYGMFCQSIPSLYPGFWLFARVYKTDGSTGAWGSSHFPEGTRLFGVALGTW